MSEILVESPSLAEIRATGSSLPLAFVLRLFTTRLPVRRTPTEDDMFLRKELDLTKLGIPGV